MNTSTFQSRIKGFLDEKIYQHLISPKEAPKVAKMDEKTFKSAVKDLAQNKVALSQLYYSNNQFNESLENLEQAIYLKQTSMNEPSTLWARLSLCLLLKDHNRALEALFTLKSQLDSPLSSASSGSSSGNGTIQKEILYSRTWWIYHSLLLLPYAGANLHVIGETYFSWINVLETTCPWVLRYLAYIYTVSSIGKKYSANTLKEVAVAISTNSYLYSDSITSLFCTANSLDFDESSDALVKCEGLLKADFILKSFDSIFFMNSARMYLFSFYCRIHSTITFENTSKLLHLPAANLKVWLEKYISDRSFDKDVKLSISGTTLLVTVPRTKVYDDILLKCRVLNDRAALLERIVA